MDMLVTGIVIGAVVALLIIAMLAPRFARRMRTEGAQQS
jgi:gas vesicle protein